MDTIYLDHAATTPLRPEVREALIEALETTWGNPSSVHGSGRAARWRLEEARERVASVLGAQRSEIVFTASGTESDNLAVVGRWRAARAAGGPEGGEGAVVCTAVEHNAVLGAVETAGREGAEVVLLGVDESGRLELDTLSEALGASPAVVSVMWANNELGTVQPVTEVAERCREAGLVFHTDAVQAFGRERVRVDEVGCDLLTLSAHKVGGPKGVGVLYVREGVELEPLVRGGGQERGLRSGTEDVAGAVACALALELAEAEREEESERLCGLRDRLETGLREQVDGLTVNAADAPRLPHLLHVSVPLSDPGTLIAALDLEGLAVSSGSACRSGAVGPSHVLKATGLAADDKAPVRFSLGRPTTASEVERAIEIFARVVARIRELERA